MDLRRDLEAWESILAKSEKEKQGLDDKVQKHTFANGMKVSLTPRMKRKI